MSITTELCCNTHVTYNHGHGPAPVLLQIGPPAAFGANPLQGLAVQRASPFSFRVTPKTAFSPCDGAAAWAALVPGWRYFSEGSQPSRALRRTPSCASMDCGLAPPAEFLADIEVVFEVSDLAAEPSSGATPASWFCPPEA